MEVYLIDNLTIHNPNHEKIVQLELLFAVTLLEMARLTTTLQYVLHNLDSFNPRRHAGNEKFILKPKILF